MNVFLVILMSLVGLFVISQLIAFVIVKAIFSNFSKVRMMINGE